MSLRVAARIARREMRGGLRGFWVFLACLTLGVGAIAAVGSVRAAINAGLAEEGAALLGGDAELRLTYRFAEPQERAFLDDLALEVSEIVDFRSMAVAGEERSVTQVKGVDDAYPLLGEVTLDPPMPLDHVFAGADGRPGGAMDRILADRLGLALGDTFRLGVQEFTLMATVVREPDAVGATFGFGPRTLVATEALANAELLGPGTLYTSQYRMLLPPGLDLDSARATTMQAFEGSGARWRDSRRAAPGVDRFVERIGSFLVLVGLAGLAVGGVGVSAAVRSYLDRKTATIATLKTLGAETRTILAVYFLQIGALTALGIALGMVLGALVPFAVAPLLADQLPVPPQVVFRPAPLLEAALYGALTALVFTLWPLARTENVRAAAIFRGIGSEATVWPRWPYLAAIAAVLALLTAAAAWFAEVPLLAFATLGGIVAALLALVVVALLVQALARRAARARALRGRTALRMALGAIANPREGATAVILSLGLGLTVLAAVGQIDTNLRNAISADLPDRAPSYFFLDIQNDQLAGFSERLNTNPDVSRVDTAPMLRGVITAINDIPAREHPRSDHWVLRGDRGITYAATQDAGVTLTDGTWWEADYIGPPLVSFGASEGAELGLRIGDTVTVNILGRDITAEIANFREVDFSTGGMGFVMTMTPEPMRSAPHTHIATVYAAEGAEGAILRELSNAYPNITAIRVREAADRVSEALGQIATATSYAALATLLTGFVVLIGAAAAGVGARIHEAAILKTLGATRRTILTSFALRAGLMGMAAALVAIGAGAAGAWAIMHFVMNTAYRFEPISATIIILGGVAATLIAGLAFAARPISARPARILRAEG
ncbi:FtsX-like permease family protein [Rhodobacteraceae bacterium 2376]|uniref:FtsX-like permease family protein n=1 Tax=Rhabdonatronobacter sediminivivens TaxID=2743469 RepID=A0A7Z0I0Z6_9RHOB|nr:FtsX-like permease family protein [Rhabdonatronobacter sediminivivens]NYS25935.1 FtsX-like permease family protein [Rhabdonatronobacter sediminivivens]